MSFYIRGNSVFSTVQFTVPGFSFFSFHGTFETSKTKIVGIAIDGPTDGSINDPRFCLFFMQAHWKMNFQLRF